MICVRCTKNNAPERVYLCAYCKDRPYFRKQKVTKNVFEEFEKLPQKKQTEILFLVHQRLMSLIAIARLDDFKLNELLNDYTCIANSKSEELREDIAMKYVPPTNEEKDRLFTYTDYKQYVSPRRDQQP